MSVVGLPVQREESIIAAEKHRLNSSLGFLTRPITSDSTLPPIKIDPKGLSGTAKYAISQWIRQLIAKQLNRNETNQARNVVASAISWSLTVQEYHALCQYLEDLEDLPVLADILEMLISQCKDRSLLEAMAETVNFHAEIFQAIGAASRLLQLLLESTKRFCTESRLDRSILTSLIDIGERLPGHRRIVVKLRRQLLLCETTTSTAVCSPVSDHMADTLQSVDLTSEDETQALLHSGTSMDSSVMSRVFTVITRRLQKAWTTGREPVHRPIDLLLTLRNFGAETFQSLLGPWVQDSLHLAGQRSLQPFIVPLVCSGLVTIRTILEWLVQSSTGGPTSGSADASITNFLCLLFQDVSEINSSDIPVRPPNSVWRSAANGLYIDRDTIDTNFKNGKFR